MSGSEPMPNPSALPTRSDCASPSDGGLPGPSEGAEPSVHPSPVVTSPLALDAGAGDAVPTPSDSDAAGQATGEPGSTSVPGTASPYAQLVLQDVPVAFWEMRELGDAEPDLSGNGHVGNYRGGGRTSVSLPNGDDGLSFNGEDAYLQVDSSPVFSIPTTGNLTWEAWLRPDVLQFPNSNGDYIDWMGKCEQYSGSCEWEARLYNADNDQDRCSRISAYAFNPSAGLGSAADWQPECGLIQAGSWYHVVAEYTLQDAPADCDNTDSYPGSIEIWVNGVRWDHGSHGQTGCMSQYEVVPKAGDSSVTIGTMARDTWFQGAIGKVAIYDDLLSEDRITAHYRAMTGLEPSGSCDDQCSF